MKKKNTEFQVGDRVVVVDQRYDEYPPVGMEGVVARISMSGDIGVRFEGWYGHSLNIKSDPPITNGWWMPSEFIELKDDMYDMKAAMDIESLFE